MAWRVYAEVGLVDLWLIGAACVVLLIIAGGVVLFVLMSRDDRAMRDERELDGWRE